MRSTAPLGPGSKGHSFLARGAFIAVLLQSSGAFAGELFVNGEDASCQGHAPCYATIQDAVDDAVSGDRVQIQPGTYSERLRIRRKKQSPTPVEADRIVIGRAADAPPDSVILDGERFDTPCGPGIEVRSASYVTIRGLLITGFTGPALTLRGGAQDNAGIHIERNRIVGNGGADCSGGIVIQSGSPGALVVNNLVHGNAGNGIQIRRFPGKRQAPAAGPLHLVQNTIHGNEGNGIEVGRDRALRISNNAVTGNGSARGGGRSDGYGIVRESWRDVAQFEFALQNNLLCGNVEGEASGPVFASTHAGNWTPTGAEAAGVLASPACASADAVYQDPAGSDGSAGTPDDDFAPIAPSAGAPAPPSPVIDRGLDPRELGLGPALEPVVLADFAAEGVRPIQRDVQRPLDFDIGALESDCPCFDECEQCEMLSGEGGLASHRCALTYDAGSECCDRTTGAVSLRLLGSAYDECTDTRSQRPDFDPESAADGCSAGVPPDPNRPLPMCPGVRFGCDEDDGEANCPEGINLPCNRHDFCYQTCGRTREQCDDEFFIDMLVVCAFLSPAEDELCGEACAVVASQYFTAVSLFAGQAYENGQNRSCQCCQNTFPPLSQP